MTALVCDKGHAVIELAGFAEPVVHPLCVNRGDATCRFEAWRT